MPRGIKLDKLNVKFSSLTKSKDSIQSLSLWIICHKTYRDEITNEWLKALREANIQHRLTLFYLANDVLQNCKRRDATEFRLAFAQVLDDAMGYVKDEIKDEVLRLIHIWGERNVFNSSLLKLLQDQVNKDPEANKEDSNLPDVKNEEMLKNFRPENLVAAFRFGQSCQPDRRVPEKYDDVDGFSSKEIDELNVLDIRLHSDMRQVYNKLEITMESLQKRLQETDEDIDQENSSVKMIEVGETFYASQFEDVRKVAQAYKIFGKKLKKVKDALQAKMETLEESVIEILSSPDVNVVCVDEGDASLFSVDRTQTISSDDTMKDEGIAIDTHMSFFNQGMAFSTIINETENKREEAEEIKSSSQVDEKLQTAKQPLEHIPPKCKKTKIETPEIKQQPTEVTSPNVKSEDLDMECKPDLAPLLPKLKTETHRKRKRHQEQTPLPKHEMETVSEKDQTKLSNIENKTKEIELKIEKLNQPTERISNDKTKTESLGIERQPKELELDPEIISPKLAVETSRRSFKPIKLNLVSPSKVKHKSDDDQSSRSSLTGETKSEEHQLKEFNIELLPEAKEEEEDIDLELKVEPEEQKHEQKLSIETDDRRIENSEITEIDQILPLTTEIKSEELLKILAANDLASKCENKDLDIDDKNGDTKISENGCDNSKNLKEPDTIESGKANSDFFSAAKRTDEETLSEIFREKEVTQEEPDNKSDVKSCNEIPKPSPVSVPPNVPLSTERCLLESMRVLSLLLSKKKMVDSDSRGEKTSSKEQQPAIFPLRTLIPIYSHSVNARKKILLSDSMEENVLMTQNLADNSQCAAKNGKIDSNLELMDMDLDSEDDN